MKDKIFKLIIRLRFFLLAIFIIATVFCGILITKVDINSDISKYLERDSMSQKSVEFLKDNFDIKGDVLIATSSKLSEMEKLKNIVGELIKVQNVTDQILWLGNFELFFINPSTGESNLMYPETYTAEQRELVGKYFFSKTENGTDGVFIFQIKLDVTNQDKAAYTAIDDIENVLKNSFTDYYIGGNAIASKTMLESALGDLPKFLIVAVIIIFLILFLTSKSFVEPFIFMLTISFAIVLNLGSNFIFDSVSTVTMSAAAILQLALAMDYSIFLTHAYSREREMGLNKKDAMLGALKSTFSTVSSSALTTMAGFLALLIMKFMLGFDLGIVLAKGVLISAICVFTLQPAMILIFDKLITKTTHKTFKPKYKLLSALPSKIKYLAIILAIVLFIPSIYMQNETKYYYLTTSYDKNAIGSQKVVQDLGSQVVFAIPEKTKIEHKKFLSDLYSFDAQTNMVNDVTSFYTFINPDLDLSLPQNIMMAMFAKELSKEYIQNNYILYTMYIDGNPADAETLAALLDIEQIIKNNFGEEYFVAGNLRVVHDLSEITKPDFIKVSFLSAIVILLILVLTFKSILVPILLVVLIELAIFINLSITALIGIPINFMTYIIISAIQLGATVDYAILLSSKFLANLKTLNKKEAIKLAMKESVPSILLSISILATSCLSVYFIASDPIIREITLHIARGSLISGLVVIFILPCYLLLAKKNLNPKTDQFELEIKPDFDSKTAEEPNIEPNNI